jgi:hypothetical protein
MRERRWSQNVDPEALAWLTDVAKLDRDQAVDLMRWSARALLHAALTWTPPGTTSAGQQP